MINLSPEAKGWLRSVSESLGAGKKAGLLAGIFKPKPQIQNDQEPLAGCVLERYQFGKILGLGTVGAVFETVHLDDPEGPELAVKVLAIPTSEDQALLFAREVEIGQKLRHPTIVRTYETQKNDVAHFVVMERVRGQNLTELIGEKPWPKDRILSVFGPLADGLHYAHQQGVVHRDLKPDNVMITADGEVKIFDFGLAQLKGSTEVTITGQFKGTPLYTSPEQIKDSKYVGPACDQFSYGTMVFEAISGKFPYELDPKQPLQALFVRLQQPAKLLRSEAPDQSAELEAVVAKMLSMEPDHRYPTVAEAFEALSSVL